MRILFISVAIVLLGACSFVGFPGVYKIDVEQGNIVTQEMADQLKPGMSRRQVRFIMGTPLIEDTFSQDRWDYPYVKRNGPNILDQSLLTVIFDGDSLLTVSGDYLPPAWGGTPAPVEGQGDEMDEGQGDEMNEGQDEEAGGETLESALEEPAED